MKVAEVMTHMPITVASSDAVQRAEELMSSHRIRQLPVVDAGHVVGMITDRDLRSLLSGQLFFDTDARARALAQPVREVMSPAPFSLRPDDNLQTAITLFIDEKVGGVPVTDKDNNLLGIVTYVDLMRCFLQRLQEEE